ncbi:hypothetical protein PVK06_006961 [Gossypium arboreum]|uniref:DUF4283 domain-containing protein n=1 Tax=Gossypium arboreum TaxID=29729 RepID=A0ABR0QGZ4_GOSAR|nr:hypothetical protein PVK06_006961 [Gossypium arboreum]
MRHSLASNTALRWFLRTWVDLALFLAAFVVDRDYCCVKDNRLRLLSDEILCIREVEGNVVAISFNSERMMRRAIEESPWSIMGNPLRLQRWEGDLVISEIDFSWIQFWIQIHNIPLESN